MAYIHCHKCSWQQDDFYESNGYNPAKYLMRWNNNLFSLKIDELFTNDSQFIKENGNLTTREVLARQYEKFAKHIRKMKWITWEQYKNDPNKVCPECGSNNLDVD